VKVLFWIAGIAAVLWWLGRNRRRALGGGAGIPTSGLLAVLETGGRAIERLLELGGRLLDPVGFGTSIPGNTVNPSAAALPAP